MTGINDSDTPEEGKVRIVKGHALLNGDSYDIWMHNEYDDTGNKIHSKHPDGSEEC